MAQPVLIRTDRRGRVLGTSGGDAELAARIAPGGTLAPLVADPGAAPLLDFLLALRRGGAALAREVPAAPGGGLHFAGVTAGEASWIAVAREEGELAGWCRALLAEGGRELDPRPAPGSLERLGALLAEVGPRGAEPAGAAETVALLERRLAEKEREIADLRARLARLEADP